MISSAKSFDESDDLFDDAYLEDYGECGDEVYLSNNSSIGGGGGGNKRKTKKRADKNVYSSKHTRLLAERKAGSAKARRRV
eukprot:CAMPEP_0194082332 /NCGR_PEP_ID=MMETSP0149-20130528/7872_1 /TAXON_ID=122233 /ORGANISM="Chaetoceros debilis, Strain MM31A-1" /LENGTH=80 /DNA_ID=CAMNT_0038764463 /DNA_START=94 /DNA_END=336 /DNA_ORIENTATION=+